MAEDPFRRRRAVVAVLAWGAFAAAWCSSRRAQVRTCCPDSSIPGSIVLVARVNAYWLHHNRQTCVGKGRRRGVPVVQDARTHDQLARPPFIDVPAMRSAREVVVDVDATGKRFWAVS